ncbi:MAG TPA: hypothetical protein VFT64_06790 [Rickettsiales bacterium]|nr:hypothetical protein [Rickettsiales bacterium]
MPKPIKSHIKLILAKNNRSKKILEAINYGWNARDLHPDSGIWRRKSTRAHVIWEATVQKAIELFADDKGAKVFHHFDTVSFVFDDTVFMRFKKADISLRSRNIRTALADMFHEHESDLFGFEGHQRVEACYVLNPLETEISWAGIVAREKKTHLWHFSFDEVTEVAQGEILEFKGKPKVSVADLATVKKDKTIKKKDDTPNAKEGE